MKKARTWASILLAALLLTVMIAPAMAANSVYTPVSGIEYTITESLYIEDIDIQIPEVTYKLELLNDVPLTEDEQTVDENAYEGKAKIKEGKGSITFNSDSEVHGSGSNYGRHLTGEFVIDFSDVKFYEPGIYRYNLKKTKESTAINADKITNTRSNDYVLVYVANSSEKTLTQAVYVHDDTNETAAGTTINKNFIDGVKSTRAHLNIIKTVDGNAASQSEYFEFTIKLENGTPGAKYKIDGNFDDETSITSTNSEKINNVDLIKYGEVKTAEEADPNNGIEIGDKYITIGQNGTYEGKVWLRHKNNFQIIGLAAGVKYTVSEDAKGYAQTFTEKSASASNTIVNDADLTIGFVNTKIVETPTGINLQVAGPIFGLLLVGLLLVVVMTGKRKEN